MFENVILLIVGLLVGLGSGIYFLRNKFREIYSSEVINLNNDLQKSNHNHDLEINHNIQLQDEKIKNYDEKITLIEKNHLDNLKQEKDNYEKLLDEKEKHYEDKIIQLNRIVKEKNDDKEHIVKNITKDFKVSATEVIKEINKDTQDFSKKTFTEDKKVIQEFGTKIEKLNKTVDNYQLTVNTSHQSIVKDLRAFSKAFDSSPNIRGEFGQENLRNLLENFGMVKNIDFLEQDKFYRDDEKLIPDCIYKIPNNKNIAIDAKAPMFHYKSAMETEDDKKSEELLKKHAQVVRLHMKKLSEKAYWDRITLHSPQFVIMYIPGEHFYFTALKYDPKLLTDAFMANVIISCPSHLFAHIKIATNMWSDHYADENIKNVISEAKEIHSRWVTMQEHLIGLRKSILSVQKNFNGFIGSYTHKLMPQINKFRKYGVDSGKIIEHAEPIETDIKKIKVITDESLKEPKLIRQPVK